MKRWRQAGVGLLTAVAAYLAGAWAADWPPFADAPAFWASVPAAGQTYTCNGGTGPAIFIRFRAAGQVATVRVAGQTRTLRYDGDEGMFEIYRGEGWMLSLDPEANLSGPAGQAFRNCY